MKSLALLFLCGATALAQAVLEGEVVNALSGARLTGVNVYVDHPGHTRLATRTDGSGHFHLVLDRMPSYLLCTGYPGYLPNDKELKMPGSGVMANLRIELSPGAVIVGLISDEDGFPLEMEFVHLLGYRTSAGERKLESVTYTKTDDLGRFRFANLRPGRYWLVASANSLWDARCQPEYFPGVYHFENAGAIDLKPGQQFTANLAMRKQEGVTVSGRVEPPNSPLSFYPEGPQVYSTYPLSLHPDGSFVVRHVPPGKYRLSAGDYSNPSRSNIAELHLTVGRQDISGILLQGKQPKTVTLPYRMVGIEPPSEPLELTLQPHTDSGIPPATGEMPQGSLWITSPLPEHYYINVHQRFLQHGPGDGGIPHPISAQLNGTEVLQTGFDLYETTSGPLVITLSNQPIEIRGKLLDPPGRPVAGEGVALISPQGVPEAGAITGVDGSFHATVWHPGEYRVVLITDKDEWNDPDFLLSQAARFPTLRLAAGATQELNLRLPPPIPSHQ
jgi:hypothetical protein